MRQLHTLMRTVIHNLDVPGRGITENPRMPHEGLEATCDGAYMSWSLVSLRLFEDAAVVPAEGVSSGHARLGLMRRAQGKCLLWILRLRI